VTAPLTSSYRICPQGKPHEAAAPAAAAIEGGRMASPCQGIILQIPT
jgi:hypothetical protein